MPFNALSDPTEEHQPICWFESDSSTLQCEKQTVGFVEKCVKGFVHSSITLSHLSESVRNLFFFLDFIKYSEA